MKVEEKAMLFYIGIANTYRDEDDRTEVPKIEGHENGDVTDDIYAMLLAINSFYCQVTGDNETDILGFTHILNRLAVNYVMREDNSVENES